ncbi:MAG: nascent polypeptide-associated complex protein [Thermoproteota archaeon]
MAFNPKMSKRETERLLRRMGISMEELKDVEEVRILTNNKTIVVKNPQVVRLMASGTPIFQVAGEISEEEREVSIRSEHKFNEEDVLFVAQQTGKSPNEARIALIDADGDLAKAILLLKS